MILSVFLVMNSWLFINGELINQFNTQSDTKVGVIFDPKYEETLKFIRDLPNDGKILVLPFSDSYMQVVYGSNDGAYVGHSMIGQLTGKKDFVGYMDMAPYSDIFWRLSQERNYSEINRLFGLLNIQYIFYNSDPRVYDATFPGFPYSQDYVRKFMPKDQAEYKVYIDKLSLNKIFEQGPYQVYKIGAQFKVPHLYVSNNIITYNDNPTLSTYNKASNFIGDTISAELRTSYVHVEDCKFLFINTACTVNKPIQQADTPVIKFQKINPVKYRVNVSNAKAPYLLIFSESFHKNWKISLAKHNQSNDEIIGSYFDGQVQEIRSKNQYFDPEMLTNVPKKFLAENPHVEANGYANAWYITPTESLGEQSYELNIEFTGQRLFYWSILISGVFVLITVGFIVQTIKQKKF